MSEQNINGVVVIEGHVQGLANTRALGEIGIPVIVIDKHSCIARYSKYCKIFFNCPDYYTEEFISFLVNLAEREKINGWSLLPSNDHAVYNISKNKKKLIPFYKVITPDINIIDRIYNKCTLIKTAIDLNVPVPITYNPVSSNSIDSKFKFPVITKGIFGLSFYKKMEKKAFLAHDKKQLMDQYSVIEKEIPLSEVFTQELIPDDGTNKTVSFTCFCIDGEIKTYWMGIKLREHPYLFGTATYCRSVHIEELFNPSQLLMKKLNYTGACEVEYIKDPRDQRYKLIEINARTWLWVELAKRCSINFPVIIYNYLNNIPNDYKTSYQIHKDWIHFTTDIPYSFAGLLRGKYSFKDLLNSYLNFPSPAVFNIKDFAPTLAEIFLIPYFLLYR